MSIKPTQMPGPPKSFRIDRDTDYEACEGLIWDFQNSPGLPLKLATDLRLDALPGGAALAAQTLISWARSAECATLLSYAKSEQETQTLENSVARLHGLVAAMMCSKILAQDGSDISLKLYELAHRRVAAMDALATSAIRRGQMLPLLCVDHSTLRFLRPFYYQGTKPNPIRTRAEFKGLLSRLIPEVTPTYDLKLKPHLNDLATLLHELFTNTHVHARSDALDVRYRKSVRGVLFAQRAVRLDWIAGAPPESALASYLRLLRPHARARHVMLLELSIFDSGPGFAAKMAREELGLSVSLDKEFELVNRCFLKNKTSISEQGYGMGLPRVMRVLKEHGGFLGLRTGRLSLSRFFDPASPDRASKLNTHDLTLTDSETSSGVLTRKGSIAGASVTIFLPLGLNLGHKSR